MSWKAINEIIGLAATDDDFAQKLLIRPVETAEKWGYQLTPEEQEAFRLSASDTLSSFSQKLLRCLHDPDCEP